METKSASALTFIVFVFEADVGCCLIDLLRMVCLSDTKALGSSSRCTSYIGASHVILFLHFIEIYRGI